MSSSKGQKTMLNYFSKQKKSETTCKSCNEKLPFSKYTWHQDFECKASIKKAITNTTSKTKTKMTKKRKDKLKKSHGESDDDVVIIETVNNQTSEIKEETFDVMENKKNSLTDYVVTDIEKDWESSNSLSASSPKKKINVTLESSSPNILEKNTNICQKSKYINTKNGRKLEKPKFNFDALFDSNSYNDNTDMDIKTTENIEVNELSNQSFASPIKFPRIVSPERTPTPSPDKSESPKKVFLSPKVKRSPSQFLLKKKLDEANVEIVNGSNSFQSPHKMPYIVHSQLKKTNLQKSPTKVNFKRNLFKQNYKEADHKYRKEKGMYLSNILFILNIVSSQTENLNLLKDDMNLFESFQNLSLQAQKLYIRLFHRKLKWQKVAKLDYNEICDKEDIFLYVNELVYAGFLLSEYEISNVSDLLHQLENPELKLLCKEVKVKGDGNKSALINKLLNYDRQQTSSIAIYSQQKSHYSHSRLFTLALKRAGKLCLTSECCREAFMRLLLLYSPPQLDDDSPSGSLYGALGAMLLVSIGKLSFPDLVVCRKHVFFRTREELLKFQECLKMELDIQNDFENQFWENAMKLCEKAEGILKETMKDEETIEHELSLPPFLRRFTTLSLLWHIQWLCVEALQKLKMYKKAVVQLKILLAQKIHLQDSRGRWYERLALNLHQHLKKPKECLEVITAAMSDPEVRVGHRLSLSERGRRLLSSNATREVAQLFEQVEGQLESMSFRSAPEVSINGRSLPGADARGCRRSYWVGNDGQNQTICSVEELALEHYRMEGYSYGMHCEGRGIGSIFCLLLWNIVYMETPDAFRSPHQTTPLDLDWPHFYETRKDVIEDRLAVIRDWSAEDVSREISSLWADHLDKHSLVEWSLLKNASYTQDLLLSLGMKVVSAICGRLAQDHRFTRSGFPDLVVWDPTRHISRIVEVKGPNDKLSTKQMLWLDFLLEHKANAEVCHVEAAANEGLSKRLSPALLLANGV